MLKPIKVATKRAVEGVFAIVASRYNGRYVDSMLRAARANLNEAGVRAVRIIRVPGAFEIPLAAECFARKGWLQPPGGQLSAIICLGVILKGETTHANLIGEAVTRALMQIQLDHAIPVIHEVLLLDNEAQARVRCLGKTHNRGTEAAQTALAMARVMRELKGK